MLKHIWSLIKLIWKVSVQLASMGGLLTEPRKASAQASAWLDLVRCIEAWVDGRWSATCVRRHTRDGQSMKMVRTAAVAVARRRWLTAGCPHGSVDLGGVVFGRTNDQRAVRARKVRGPKKRRLFCCGRFCLHAGHMRTDGRRSGRRFGECGSNRRI